MLGIVTEVVLRILRKPEATRTFFATFPSTTEAGNAVSGDHRVGHRPGRDRDDGPPRDAGGRRGDGPRLARRRRVASHGRGRPRARRWSTRPRTRSTSRAGRARSRSAARATRTSGCSCGRGARARSRPSGRISRDYIVQDGVIPRSRIAEVLAEIAALSREAGLRVANVFHAGRRQPPSARPLRRARARRGEARRGARRRDPPAVPPHGGSITGEHGVGADKAVYMGEMFGEDDLETMHRVRCAFDPARLLNPGKVFPTPRLCGDRPGVHVPHPAELTGEAYARVSAAASPRPPAAGDAILGVVPEGGPLAGDRRRGGRRPRGGRSREGARRLHRRRDRALPRRAAARARPRPPDDGARPGPRARSVRPGRHGRGRDPARRAPARRSPPTASASPSTRPFRNARRSAASSRRTASARCARATARCAISSSASRSCARTAPWRGAGARS